MHIVLVTGEYPPLMGGIGDYTHLLARHLHARGLQITVVAATAPASPPAAEGDFPVEQVPRRWNRRTRRRIAELARGSRDAWIHVQYQTAAFNMNPGVNLAAEAWRRRGLSVAWTYHDLLPPYLLPRIGARIRHDITLRPARASALVISTNHPDRQHLRARGIPAHMVPVGSNIPVQPLDADRRRALRGRWNVSDRGILIGYFGLAHRSKGLQALVEALRLLRHRGVNAHLLIIGGDPGTSDRSNLAFLTSIHNLIRTADLESRVTWTGPLPPETVSHALSACDLMALPYTEGASTRHGSLIACLEHGCVTITTIPQDAAMLEPGVPIVPRRSFEALADTIESLIHSPDRQATARTAALASVAERSWDVIADRHLELYESSRHPPSRHAL